MSQTLGLILSQLIHNLISFFTKCTIIFLNSILFDLSRDLVLLGTLNSGRIPNKLSNFQAMDEK